MFVPEIARTEGAGAISRITGQSQEGLAAAQWIKANMAVRRVGLDRRLMDSATSLAAQLKIRGADAVYLAAAHRHRVPLVTWDIQLASRASALVQVIQP